MKIKFDPFLPYQHDVVGVAMKVFDGQLFALDRAMYFPAQKIGSPLREA